MFRQQHQRDRQDLAKTFSLLRFWQRRFPIGSCALDWQHIMPMRFWLLRGRNNARFLIKKGTSFRRRVRLLKSMALGSAIPPNPQFSVVLQSCIIADDVLG